ncbi:MAG TPA: sigma-70 family RNA polymerase sigma factor [Polyangia bacterium]|nr:sigma-70 family RNA polymerase sigma factor [Polyangia bacterium]
MAPSATASHRPSAAKDCPCAAPIDEGADRQFLDWVGRLVRQHRDQLIRVARREGVTAADAFDVVQEAFGTFLTLPQAQSLVDAPVESARLLAALARNAARNRRRLAAVARPHDADDAALDALPAAVPSVEELIATAEETVRLRGCVQSLGDIQRAVVTLRMLEEIDGADVARALGITPGHVAVLLHRAKANLQACMTAPRRA